MSIIFKATFCVHPVRIVGLASIAWLMAFAANAWDFTRLEQLAAQRYGAQSVSILRDFKQILRNAHNLPEIEKLKRINEFFNRRIRFESDMAVWNQEDYWATPLEFMGKKAGDCEDFSIAKYFSLRELGVGKEKLRLTYVRAKIGGPASNVSQAHMVLTYYSTPDAEPLVLDNLITDIRPASRRPDLTPVYSFNTDGVFTGNGSKPAAPVDRLSRWKDLLAKMRAEGMEP